MPRGGANRLPDAVKAARGTLQPVRINPSMPLPEPVASLPAPRSLGKQGKAFWRSASGIMAKLGYLTTAYAAELEGACFWYERFQGLRVRLADATGPDGSFEIEQKLHRMALEASKELYARLAKLGFNPQDIGRVRAQKVEGEDEELKRLLGLDPGRVN